MGWSQWSMVYLYEKKILYKVLKLWLLTPFLCLVWMFVYFLSFVKSEDKHKWYCYLISLKIVISYIYLIDVWPTTHGVYNFGSTFVSTYLSIDKVIICCFAKCIILKHVMGSVLHKRVIRVHKCWMWQKNHEAEDIFRFCRMKKHSWKYESHIFKRKIMYKLTEILNIRLLD